MEQATKDIALETSSCKAEAERILDAWIAVSTAIRNERFVSELTYNESLVCRILVSDAAQKGEGLIATRLCQKTQMKKSQMNRTLTALESRGLIIRRQSGADRRCQLVTINAERMREFNDQHARIIEFVSAVAEELGETRAHEVMTALEDMAEAVQSVSSLSR